MSIRNALKLIEDNQRLKTSLSNIQELPYELPYLMQESLELLDDTNFSRLSDSEIKSVCYMLDMYFSACFYEFADNKLDGIIRYGKIEIYKVQAHNGLRYATENEVAHGIKGLIPEYIYPAGEESYKQLCLLQWTFTGKSYFFRQLGHNLNYSSDGKVLNTFWEMLQMSAAQIKELVDWMRGNHLEKVTKILNKVKRAGGYKYAQYESDEIEESITVKQLVYNILNTFPRNSSDMDYRKALALALAKSKNNRVLSPYEISQLRQIYDKYALDKDRSTLIKQSRSGASNILKEECETLIRNKNAGVLDPNDFVFKIIGTIERSGYTKCSLKQHKFIEEALKKINENVDEHVEAEVITEDEIDTSLVDMYDALGSGLFEG